MKKKEPKRRKIVNMPSMAQLLRVACKANKLGDSGSSAVLLARLINAGKNGKNGTATKAKPKPKAKPKAKTAAEDRASAVAKFRDAIQKRDKCWFWSRVGWQDATVVDVLVISGTNRRAAVRLEYNDTGGLGMREAEPTLEESEGNFITDQLLSEKMPQIMLEEAANKAQVPQEDIDLALQPAESKKRKQNLIKYIRIKRDRDLARRRAEEEMARAKNMYDEDALRDLDAYDEGLEAFDDGRFSEARELFATAIGEEDEERQVQEAREAAERVISAWG